MVELYYAILESGYEDSEIKVFKDGVNACAFVDAENLEFAAEYIDSTAYNNDKHASKWRIVEFGELMEGSELYHYRDLLINSIAEDA